MSSSQRPFSVSGLLPLSVEVILIDLVHNEGETHGNEKYHHYCENVFHPLPPILKVLMCGRQTLHPG
jgi:hypothetical protein